MSEKRNPHIPILILGWTGLVLLTALVLVASWWGYFVSTDDGVVDYLIVVIIITFLWSVIAFIAYCTLEARRYDEIQVTQFLIHDSSITIEKSPGKRFRAFRTGSPNEVAYGDTVEKAVSGFVHGCTRKVKEEEDGRIT